MFSAFNKPWNNGSVEGTNSIFIKKIWIQRYHRTLVELDDSIAQFNREYADRITNRFIPGLSTDYSVNLKTVTLATNLDNPTIYFTRQVESSTEQTCIRVLKVQVKLSDSYLKQFVLAKLDIYKEQLTIYYEIEPGKLQMIESLKFPIKYY